MRHPWPWLVLLAAYVLAFAANVGHFAWSYDAGWLQIAASVLYAAVWIAEAVLESRTENRMRLPALLGVLTVVGGILGLLARTLGYGWLTLLALLTAGLSVTPLYGLLSLVQDYDFFYLAAAAVGCLIWVITRIKKRT